MEFDRNRRGEYVPVEPVYDTREKGRGKRPQVILWGPIALATLLGAINISIGILGVLTWYDLGPLSSVIIPIDAFRGPIINLSNIASLITGIAAVIGATSGYVSSGLSRAWLLRRALNGDGISIRRWRAAASSGSLRHVGKTPLIAGGVALAAIAAGGITSSAFSGVLVPNSKINHVNGIMSSVPGYAGNTGIGQMVSCLNTSTAMICPPSLQYQAVAQAMSGAAFSGTSPYQLEGLSVSPGSDYNAGLVGNLDGFASISIANTSELIEYNAVGLQTSASCTRNLEVGVNETTGQFEYMSQCLGHRKPFGDSANEMGTYSDATGCPGDNFYRIEYVVAGAQVDFAGQTAATNPIAFDCQIQANEGLLRTYSYPDYDDNSFGNFTPGDQLTGPEIRVFASAIIAAVFQDTAINGKAGPISIGVSFLRPNGSVQPDMAIAAGMMANAAAAAATAGYLALLPSSNPSFYNYPKVHSGTYSYYYASYGWVGHTSMLAWASF